MTAAPQGELVGRRVSVGISCLDPQSGREVDRFAVVGTIEEADQSWIAIRRDGLPALFGLPPRPEEFSASDDGTLVASLSVRCSDPEELLELRGRGYVPA